MQKYNDDNNLIEAYIKAIDALADDAEIDLSCANPAPLLIEDKITNNNIINPEYPTILPELVNAFGSKIRSFGIPAKNKDIGLCNSIFPKINEIVSSLVLQKHKVILYLPMESFGYFYKTLESSGANVVLLKSDQNGKIDLQDLKDKLKLKKDKNEIRSFVFLNPVNPKGIVYSQDEVNTLANTLNGKIDFIIDDITFLGVHAGRLPLLEKGFFEEEDVARLKNLIKPGILSKSPAFKDGNIIIPFYSMSKELNAATRISCYVLHDELYKKFKKWGVNLYDPIRSFEFAEHTQKLAHRLLTEESRMLSFENIKYYKNSFDNIKNHCITFNKHLSSKLGIPYRDFIKISPDKYQATNVTELDCSGFRDLIIAGTRPQTGLDMYHFFIENAKTKLIPGEANFIPAEKMMVRIVLGEKSEKVDRFFAKLEKFMLSNDLEVKYDKYQNKQPVINEKKQNVFAKCCKKFTDCMLYLPRKLITTNNINTNQYSKVNSNDDDSSTRLDIGNLPQTVELKQMQSSNKTADGRKRSKSQVIKKDYRFLVISFVISSLKSLTTSKTLFGKNANLLTASMYLISGKICDKSLKITSLSSSKQISETTATPSPPRTNPIKIPQSGLSNLMFVFQLYAL